MALERGTQKKLTEELGVSKSTVSRRVRDGKVDPVRVTQISNDIRTNREVSENLDKMNGRNR